VVNLLACDFSSAVIFVRGQVHLPCFSLPVHIFGRWWIQPPQSEQLAPAEVCLICWSMPAQILLPVRAPGWSSVLYRPSPFLLKFFSIEGNSFDLVLIRFFLWIPCRCVRSARPVSGSCSCSNHRCEPVSSNFGTAGSLLVAKACGPFSWFPFSCFALTR
jgi:hypothetical protein